MTLQVGKHEFYPDENTARIEKLETEIGELREALISVLTWISKGGVKMDYGGRPHPMLSLLKVIQP